MKPELKDLGALEKEIIKNSSGSFPVLILDTGGLIDIANEVRRYNLIYKNGNRNLSYEKPTIFLKYLSKKFPIIITPKTYQEIQDHGRMRLNGHTVELSPKIVNYSLERTLASASFISMLKKEFDTEQTRYDAYWASKEG